MMAKDDDKDSATIRLPDRFNQPMSVDIKAGEDIAQGQILEIKYSRLDDQIDSYVMAQLLAQLQPLVASGQFTTSEWRPTARSPVSVPVSIEECRAILDVLKTHGAEHAEIVTKLEKAVAKAVATRLTKDDGVKTRRESEWPSSWKSIKDTKP